MSFIFELIWDVIGAVIFSFIDRKVFKDKKSYLSLFLGNLFLLLFIGLVITVLTKVIREW